MIIKEIKMKEVSEYLVSNFNKSILSIKKNPKLKESLRKYFKNTKII